MYFVSFAAGMVALCLFASASATTIIEAPLDGDVFDVKPCPNELCFADVPLKVRHVNGPADTISVIFENDSGRRSERILCRLDLIEGQAGCKAPPQVYEPPKGIVLTQGVWKATPKVMRGGRTEFGASISFTVNAKTTIPAGPVALSKVEPSMAAARYMLRKEKTVSINGSQITKPALFSESDSVRIYGDNLDNNPFLRVYLSPIPAQESALAVNSALPAGDWCLFEAKIINRDNDPVNGSFLEVELPTLPETVADACTATPRPKGSVFTAKWRWVIRDPWIRPERQHRIWAIPTPRDKPWKNAPAFQVVKPSYPEIDGFGFRNKKHDSSFNEFLTVFGDSAYHCVDCLPGLGCACQLPRIIDPFYLLWYPVYSALIDSSDGSCNGMAATSRLFANGALKTTDFDPDVLFPAGFRNDGQTTIYDPKYKDSNICTPWCSPPKPDNLWATVRKNHGAQISREFVSTLLQNLGEAIVDPNDQQVVKGIPAATFDRVRTNPRGYVTCFTEFGGGHCVTPYAVNGDTMKIYDNNYELEVDPEIRLVNGNYDYLYRRNKGKSPNNGNFIIAYPMSIWTGRRHLVGLGNLSVQTAEELIEFLYTVVVGDADQLVEGANGQIGWRADGSHVETLPGAMALPPLGESESAARHAPVVYAMNMAAPVVRINARGRSYVHQTAANGQILQVGLSRTSPLEVEDRVALSYRDNVLGGFDIRPGAAASIAPSVGLSIAENESLVFRMSDIAVPDDGSIGVEADKVEKSLSLRNGAGMAINPLITIDQSAGGYNRKVFGPFDLPSGAIHKLTLVRWPDVSAARSQVDIDGDGDPDIDEIVTGADAPAPSKPGATVDLAVTIEPDSGGGRIVIRVANRGPDAASDVMLLIVGPAASKISTNSRCVRTGGVLRCAIGDLEPEAVASLVFERPAPGPRQLVAKAFTSALDVVESNNTARWRGATPDRPEDPEE